MKVAVFLATGFEEIEALTVVDILRRGGVETTMVSISDDLFVTSARNIMVKADVTFKELENKDLTMLVLPGGLPGTTNLEACQPLMKIVDEFDSEGKYVAAICAAPSILGHRGILNGKKACCYPGYEEDLTGAIVSNQEVEVDGHIITARGMGCSIPFSLALLELLRGKELAETIKQKIIYEQR